MKKYLVIELQTSADGAVGNLVWSFDDENIAKSKYYAVLSAAAVSSLPQHSCILIQNDGTLLKRENFNRISEEE